jgi:hypothetical protein
MRIALLFLCIWPFCHKTHVEKFTLTISYHGMTSYTFKKKFSTPPTCTANGNGLEWYPDHVIVHGVPGNVVTGTCK